LLHIDDCASDRLLLSEAILLTNTPFALHEAENLESATAYFQPHSSDELRRYPPPTLVLLDYDLGNHTGVEFLHWLRVTKRITSIPVVMLSGSDRQQHLSECYKSGANYCLTKPNTLTSLMSIVRALYSSLSSSQQPSPILSLPEYRPNPCETPAAGDVSTPHRPKAPD
jgi:DNA-binding response OmpR family regulator